jgi:dTDP-4-dehydrorhamnose 3,5-epimerase
MKFIETNIIGAYLIDIEPIEDERGFFSRIFCEQEFKQHDLKTHFVQSNLSLTKKSGVIRGLHYQRDPHAEAKLVRCVQGTIFDVIVDLRTDSKTFKKIYSAELSQINYQALYLPAGCAHGFQSLTNNCVVMYDVSAAYCPDAESGIRFDDPSFEIAWPLAVTSVSEKDANWPDWQHGN